MRTPQHNVFLKDLVRQVAAGSLLPASFQRPYVWSRADVLALFESILRGYPVGGFLLWSPYGKADLSKVARMRLGPVTSAGTDQAVSLLLDGQNRLASMAWLAHDYAGPMPQGLSEQERATWNAGQRLVVDLEAQTLCFVPEAQAEQGLRLPAGCVIDSRIANPLIRARWTREWRDFSEAQRDAGLRWFDRCTNTFSDARVVVTNIEDATALEAKDAFLHICKVGVPMAAADFEVALNWAL